MSINKGKIGNALESVAPDHVVAVANDIFDETLNKYQSELNQQISQGGYNPPQGGIPKSDLSSSVQSSLDKADAAVPNTRTVNGRALSSNITLNASDVGALPSSTSLSQLTDDTTHRTVTDLEKANWSDKYTKTEVNNMISSAPESDVIVVEVPSGSDIATYLLNNVPAAQRPNNIFRVPGTNSFSEWAWNGTAFIKLDEKNYGIDDAPNATSQNAVNSKGIYKFVAEEAVFRITDFSIQSGANGIKSVNPFKWDGKRFCGYVVNKASDNREYRMMLYQFDAEYNEIGYSIVWSPFVVVDKPMTNAVYFDIRVAKRNASNTGYEAMTQEDVSHIEVYSNYPEYNVSVGKKENSVLVIPNSRVLNGTSLDSSTVYGVTEITNNVVNVVDGGTHHQLRNYLVQGNDSSGMYFSGIFDKASYINLSNPNNDTRYYNVAVVGKNGEVVYRGRLIGRNTIYVQTGYRLYLVAENIEYGKVYEYIKRDIISINHATPLANAINVTMNNGRWIKEGANGNVIEENFNEYKYALNYKAEQDGWVGGIFGSGIIRCNFMVTSSIAQNAILEKYILNGLQFIRVYKGDELTFAMPMQSTPLFIPNYDKDYIAQVSTDGLSAITDKTNVTILYDGGFTLSSNASACATKLLFRFDGKPFKSYVINKASNSNTYKMMAYQYDKDMNYLGYNNAWSVFGCTDSPLTNAVYYRLLIINNNTAMTQTDLDNVQVFTDRLPCGEFVKTMDKGLFTLLGNQNGMLTKGVCKWDGRSVSIVPYHSGGRECNAMVYQYDKDFNALGYHNTWSNNYSETPMENAVYFDIRVTKRNSGNTAYETITAEDLSQIDVCCNYEPYTLGTTINMLGDSITAEGYVTSALEKLGCTVNNYGVSGTNISGGGQSFINRYSSMTDDCDMVVVLGGVNDWRTGSTLGLFEDGAGTNTFYGALHTLCAGLKDKYTNINSNKIVYMCTPMHNQFTWPDDTYPDLPEFVIENGKIVAQSYGGGTLKQYVDAIKEVASYYSIPVIDLYNNSGIAPIQQANKEKYTKDGLHPNAPGGKLIAEAIIRELKGI